MINNPKRYWVVDRFGACHYKTNDQSKADEAVHKFDWTAQLSAPFKVIDRRSKEQSNDK